MIQIINKVECYELCVKFDDKIGFVGAQVKLFMRRDEHCKEIDYLAMQSVLQNGGGWLSFLANGQKGRTKVDQRDYLYSLLLKIQSDILYAIQKYFVASPRITASGNFRLMGSTSHPDYPDITLY